MSMSLPASAVERLWSYPFVKDEIPTSSARTTAWYMGKPASSAHDLSVLALASVTRPVNITQRIMAPTAFRGDRPWAAYMEQDWFTLSAQREIVTRPVWGRSIRVSCPRPVELGSS